MKSIFYEKKFNYLIINIIAISIVFSQRIVRAQEAISIGEKHSVKSSIMNEEREIWISLPKSYDPKLAYPVCYFFDGEGHFENLVAQTRRLSDGLYASMPEIILVGILPKDRTNELTPTAVATPDKWKRVGFATSGGYERFFKFIQEELKTYINNRYKTNGFEILVGHSFGGLVVMHTWQHHADAYRAYVAIDPSMWWDEEKLLNQIRENTQQLAQKNKMLFLAKANDTGSGEEHHAAIKKTHATLDSLFGEKSTNYQYKFYADEEHGSVVVPAEYDALRFLFKGYQMPVKAILKNPELLKKHYDAVSLQFGYKVVPSLKNLERLAEVSKKQGYVKEYEEFIRIIMYYYPATTTLP